ncbi:MAG: sialate O-acetylesterase [Oscillospiraceae bacterium]
MTNFEVAAIFSDNMVLQYLKPVNVFGRGVDGTEITVSITGEEQSSVSVTVKDGRWLAVLPPQPAQDCVELTVSGGGESVTFRNVAVGAVWLAGGQSNMELELQNCSTGSESLENDSPNVRFYYTMKKSIADDDFYESERKMGWCTFENKQSAKAWSAVGYYFAKELSEEWGMTVGIIGCNWGGTSASAWMQREYAQGETAVYFEEYDAAVAGKTIEQLKADYREYQEYHAAWEKKSAEYYSTTPDPTWDGCLEYCGENKYPGPASPLNPMSPGVLYDSMIRRIAPYTMTGVIWYQGESDDHRPEMYYTLLNQMIRNWRDTWNDDELFFVIGQLPMHRWSADEDRKNWCLIREAQARTARTDRHSALAVLTDCGEFNEIHPKNKQLPGHRFFLAALNSYYECGILEEQDICTDTADAYQVKWNSDSADVFVTCASGLEARGEISGFELADSDGVYHPAKAEIADRADWNGEPGSDVIHVYGVQQPTAVRYLWTNYTDDITLFDEENGIPLPPFRFFKPMYKG